MPNVVEITVRLNNDTAAGFVGVLASIEAVKRAAQGVGFSFDSPNIAGQILRIKQKMQAAGLADFLDFNLNQGQVEQQLLMLKRKISQAGLSDLLDVNLNQSQITEQLGKLTSEEVNIPVGFDVSKFPVVGDIAPISVPIKFDLGHIPDLPRLGATINYGNIEKATAAFRDLGIAADATLRPLFAVDNLSTLLDASIAHTASNLDSLGMAFSNAAAAAVKQSEANTTVAALSQIAADRFAMETAAVDRAQIAANRMNIMMRDQVPLWQAGSGWLASMTGNTGRWAGALGFLTSKMTLFGGAFGHLPIIGTTALWHIAADAVIEFAAVLIPATLGVVAFGAAATPTIQGIIQQMTNLSTASSALQQNIPGLSGAMQNFDDAVKPQVMSLFGDALEIANQKGSVFESMAINTGHAVDTLATRFTLAVTNGNQFSGLLSNAGPDVYKLGSIVQNVGGIIGAFISEVPGYANTLLNIGVGISRIADDTAQVIKPVIGFGLAFHGAALYIGIAATAATYLVRGGLNQIAGLATGAANKLEGLGVMGARAATGLDRVASGATSAAGLPWGWIAIAAAGFGFLAYKIITAKDATQQWFSTEETAIAGSKDLNSGYMILQGTLDQTRQLISQNTDTLNRQTDSFHRNVEAGATVSKFYNANYVPALNSAIEKNQELTADQKTLINQGIAFSDNLDKIAISAGGMKMAMGLATVAGVTMNQMMNKSDWPEIASEVDAAARAYKEMGVMGGVLGSDMNALNIAASSQVSDMGKVNQAWQSVIGILSGGQTTFVTFEQFLGQTDKLGAAAGVSIGGLTTKDLQLRASFQQTFGYASSMIDALRMMQSTSPGGFPSVTEAIKLTVAQLIPMGRQSAATRSELVDLAQEVNPNITNFTKLTTWLGNTHDAGMRLNDLVAKMGINLQDLSKDASAMSTTMNQDVINTFDLARLAANHVNAATSQLADDLASANGHSWATIHQDQITLYNDLVKSGMGAKSAAALVSDLGQQLFKLPKNVSIGVGVVGAWSVQKEENAQAVAHLTSEAQHHELALGGRIPGFGGGDIYPAWLEPGEAVVDKHTTRKHAATLGWMGVPGFSGGGLLGNEGQAMTNRASSLGMLDANSTMNTLVHALIRSDEAAARRALIGGSSSAIVNYAESFIGKVPYAWGGDTPNGWDCSGFVKFVYDHFGYSPPRTSEEQWGWVKHTPTPVTGGLAFFAGSDGTQQNPGHVGIIVDPTDMVDAYATGFGTRFNRIQGSSGAISGYGVPPGGLTGGGGPGGGGPGGGNPAQNASLAHRLYATQLAGPVWSAWNSVAMAESGWSNIAQNAGSGAYGIAQALPYTKYPKSGWPPFAGGSANPTAQINWMWDYMAGTYGGPIGAWQHEQQFHWYKDGVDAVFNKPTLIGVGDGGPEHVTVTPGGKKAPIRLVVCAGDSGEYTRFLTQQLKQYIRIEGGGDVQVALGFED